MTIKEWIRKNGFNKRELTQAIEHGDVRCTIPNGWTLRQFVAMTILNWKRKA